MSVLWFLLIISYSSSLLRSPASTFIFSSSLFCFCRMISLNVGMSSISWKDKKNKKQSWCNEHCVHTNKAPSRGVRVHKIDTKEKKKVKWDSGTSQQTCQPELWFNFVSVSSLRWAHWTLNIGPVHCCSKKRRNRQIIIIVLPYLRTIICTKNLLLHFLLHNNLAWQSVRATSSARNKWTAQKVEIKRRMWTHT